jgi:DNA (cytosine-5)-methyltransferase 1
MKVKQHKTHSDATQPSELPRLGDLFCGAGGFSLGAHLAGFHTAFAVDCDKDLTSSFRTNFPSANLLIKDLSAIGPKQLLEEVKIKPGELAGIIGGPPCQGFSIIGHRDADDPRNGLLAKYFDFVAYASPAFFIMENVPNIMSEQYKAIVESGLARVRDKYTIVGPLLVDASRYGAATKRIRAVVVGYDPTRVNALTEADIKALEVSEIATVHHAIHDLPDPQDDTDGDGWHDYLSTPKSGSEGEYARRARQNPPAGLSTVDYHAKAGKTVSGLQNTVHAPRIVERMDAMTPGGIDKTSKAKKLTWTAPCIVIRAGTGKERGSHQAVRPIHPAKSRVITVREAARIQGFPDWFQFHDTKWHSFRMIGNSVSPYVSQSLLSLLKARLISSTT